MDPELIKEIVAWFKIQQDDEQVFDDDEFPSYIPGSWGTPAQMFLTFCGNPNVLWQYDASVAFMEEPKNEEIDTKGLMKLTGADTLFVRPVEPGCNFVHTVRHRKGLPCGLLKYKESNRCRFHDQIVFCEPVWDFIQKQHDDINKLFQ